MKNHAHPLPNISWGRIRTVIGAVFALTFLTSAMLTGSPRAQEAVSMVTSDTPQYCVQLIHRVQALLNGAPILPQDVVTLSREGKTMCDNGHIRGGIMRLRRVLVLMHQGGE
jgi:hypothetical protein